jgi:hypothetical protein
MAVIGPQISGHIGSLTGSAAALAVRLAAALWTGLGVTPAIGTALDVVLARALWPRTLAGDLRPGDERTLRALAEAEQRDRRQHITVTITRFATPPRDRPANDRSTRALHEQGAVYRKTPSIALSEPAEVETTPAATHVGVCSGAGDQRSQATPRADSRV